MENIQDMQTEYYFAAMNQQHQQKAAAQHFSDLVTGAGNHQAAEQAAVAAATVYFLDNQNNIDPFDPNFFLIAANAHSYTPSYGSPQSSIYESIDSSDYDISDGYSSAGGSSGLSSPHLPTDIVFEEESLRRNSLGDLSDEEIIYAIQSGFNSNAAATNNPTTTTDNTTSYNDFSQQQFEHPTVSTTMSTIKMENPYRRSLKLDTNIATLDLSNVSGMNDDNNDNNSNEFDISQLSPSTLAQCLVNDDNNSNTNNVNNGGVSGAGPMFSFIPATPITPTKAQAIADSVYGVLSPPPPQLISIDEESIVTSQSSEVDNDSISKSISSRNTNIPASHIAKSTTAHSHPQNLSSSIVTSTVSTTPTHQHRSHRKALPQEMAERLHTMNLAPPKPQRKSKTSAPFHCPYEDCTKTFTRQYNLKSHLRTHTDERPFLCGFQGCTRAFARQHDRKRHYNLHLGFKPHVCAHCGRAFARLDALNRHLRSDSGAPCAQATLPNGGEKKFKPVNM
ncbi:13625_t:CDS:2 [Ambispora gerdemannii]|uniref:13625_t:CDS:1 n=1 Tax=Ambispora gerdemannii TaxID=144530 RepID=A0A9N8VK40_9GLOM|nr:13625_t:CDS:2 [Ambispora gerdemannii]